MKDVTPLVRALVDALLLLEFSGPDEIDPDTAVRGLETISFSLSALEVDDQRALRAEFMRIASEADDPTFSSHVASLPDSMGLA